MVRPVAPLSTPAPGAEASPRSVGLDVARAAAVIAMVLGHTMHATLSPETRAEPGIQLYWYLRGATAPMFLLVAGWAVVATAARYAATRHQLATRHLRRVGLLLLLAYGLRWPFWDLPGLFSFKESVWRHFLGFDALHCIAFSLLVSVGVLVLLEERRARILAFLGLGVGVVALSPLAWALWGTADAPLWLRQSVAGGTAQFPLLPWSGYFFLGAFLGLVRTGRSERSTAIGLLVGSAALVAILVWLGFSGPRHTSALQFLFRLGLALGFVGLAMCVPRFLGRLVVPVARSSLWVYVAHLPIVYGWAWSQGLDRSVGRTLGLAEALLLGLAVLAASLCIALLGKFLRPRIDALAALGWSRLERAWAPPLPAEAVAIPDLPFELPLPLCAAADLPLAIEPPPRAPPAELPRRAAG